MYSIIILCKNKGANMQNVELNPTITCSECGESKTEVMSTNACQCFYECESCKVLLKGCCIDGTFIFPSIQEGQDCCDS